MYKEGCTVHSMFHTALLLLPTLSATVCPVDWSYFDGTCWKFDRSPRSFSEAEKECRSQSGELVSPKGNSHFKWIDILTTPFVSLPYKPECFERDIGPAWMAPRLASHMRVSSVQECLSVCASALSLLEWECTRIVYDSESRACLLLGSSTGEGERLGVDPSFEAYNNICWMGDTTMNEVVFPHDEHASTEMVHTVEELKSKLVSIKQIDDLPTTVTVPSITAEPAFRPVPTISTHDLRKCFDRVPQVTVPGRADDIYQNISSTECLEKCVECNDCIGEDLPCMSVVYYDDVSECVLLRMSEKEGTSRISTIEDTSSLYWRDIDCDRTDKCTTHMDLIIMIDGSDSIGRNDFQKGVRVVQRIIHYIAELTTDARIRVLQIGEGIKEEIPLSSISENTLMRVGNIHMIGGRSVLGETTSRVMRDTRSDTALFILISDLFIEDNVKLIEIELNKSDRPLITLSLTESFDRKVGERLTKGDIAKMIQSRGEEEAARKTINSLCDQRGKRTKRQVQLETTRVWIGLRRTEEGDLLSSDRSTVTDLSLLSDRPSHEKKCVSSEIEWNYTECDTELPFVCAHTPLEKLESLIQRSFTITSLHMPQ